MSRPALIRVLLLCLLITAIFTGCSRDPNVRKQKYFASGEKYYAEGKYREAAIQYSNAVQIDSRFAQAHYQLSQSYLKLGDGVRASQELFRTVELAPDNYRAHTDLANLLVTVRNIDGSPSQEALKQAKPHLDLLREKVPNVPETHEAWADYYAAQNDLPNAEKEMEQAITLDQSRSESYLMLAVLQMRSNLPDRAESNFKTAVSVDPKAMNAQLALGSFYQAHNRLAEAEQQFRHAIEVDPKDPTPRAALVRVFAQEGKTEEAEALLRQTKRDLSDNSEGYTMLGDYYFAINDIDKALSEYASIFKDHPKDPKVKRNYIQLLILKNQLDEASKLNDQILQKSPRDIDALVYKAQIQIRQNNSGGAVETLQKALQNSSDNAVAHYQLGVAFSQQHDLTRAESEWREAVRLKPDLIDAQRSLGTLEIGRGDITATLQTADQIIALRPDLPEGFLIKGLADMMRQDFAEAQQDAENAAQRAPQSPAPYVQLGQIQLAQKHFSEAEKFYGEALDKDPASSDGLSGLMNTYFAEKQITKAIAAANAQIQKVPNNSNFYDLLGTALFNGNKDIAGAEVALRKAIELDKNNADALEKLGKIYVEKGSLDQALAIYQQAVKDNPGEARFYILAGELYESKQAWDQAKSMYEQALKISPDNPLACNNLAYVILEQGGNLDVAMGMAQTARRVKPDWANAADTLGWAYYRKGIYQSAINQFQEAMRLNQKIGAPDTSVFHYHLGLAYQKSNQISLARQQLEKAVKLSPDNSDARKALLELRS
jgi:tetratricopeptide (TPR) repeat protein